MSSSLLIHSHSETQDAVAGKVSDFKFLSLLGDGAYGEVWKARHKASGQYFAIKIVPKEKVTKMLAQFQREICIMYMISHSNIIRLYHHFEDSTSFYLVMELAENGTLRDKISPITPMTECEIKQYFLETMLAVEYLHSQVPPIIHRDIKPENIMFDKMNKVKLCDFGFSNYYDEERKTACGTLEYLPPEIVEKRGHDTSVDIWSLGVLLYEMFTGVTPFSDGTNEQVLKNISTSIFRCPLNIPPLAKDLISLMLDRNLLRRITAKEIKEHRWIKDFVHSQADLRRSSSRNDKSRGHLLEIKHEDLLLSPSPRDMSNSMVFSFRKSINTMKNQILDKTHGMKNTKTLVTRQKDLLSAKIRIMKELEKKLEDRRQSFNQITSNEKLIAAKIKDLDYDICRIVNVCEVGSLKQKVMELREDYLQKEKECSIQTDILKTLRQQVKIRTISIIEKEEEFRDLAKSLGQLREDTIKTGKQTEIQIHELTEFLSLLKKKLQNSINPVPLVGIDQKISEEIVAFISNYMDKNSEDLSFKIRRLISSAETKARSIEKRFSSLKIECSEEREKIITEIKKKKDIFLSNLRRKQHKDLQSTLTKNRDSEVNFIGFIEQARMKENECCAEVIDIAIARNKLYVKNI